MGKPTGFREYGRAALPLRPVEQRRRDFAEIYGRASQAELQRQGARCMDCGVPFCHGGCPLGNHIPEWADHVYRDAPTQALLRLQATNNFPEWTGLLCPAPCEHACVLGLHGDAVAIKALELGIIEAAFARGAVVPRSPAQRSGAQVAIVGSGPAGLAAAAQLNQQGHRVVVYERDDRIGGLLRYGIPDFKMHKSVIDRRLALLEAEGIVWRTGVTVGSHVSLDALRAEYDAVLLAPGVTVPRDVPVPGRALHGIYPAMAYLVHQNRLLAGDPSTGPHAAGKHVIILGGGDTGADCLGTAHRQGAASVTQLDIHARPPDVRAADNPWPGWAKTFRLSPAHEEGGTRLFQTETLQFVGNEGHVVVLRACTDNACIDLPCDLALIAVGYTAPCPNTAPDVHTKGRGTYACEPGGMTNLPGVFAAGDAQRGQSLIVWAIADGRAAARHIHSYLQTRLEVPSRPLVWQVPSA